MPRHIVTDDASRTRLFGQLAAMPLPYHVDAAEGLPDERRSLTANGLFHSWMGAIAKTEGESPAETKARCHIRWGIPILRGDDPAYAAFIESALGGKTYRAVMEIIERGFVPCTSLMNKAQLSRYMDAVWREYAGRVRLMDPEDLKWRNAA